MHYRLHQDLKMGDLPTSTPLRSFNRPYCPRRGLSTGWRSPWKVEETPEGEEDGGSSRRGDEARDAGPEIRWSREGRFVEGMKRHVSW